MIIDGNLKGAPGPVTIGQRTLIAGRTGSGKSTVIERAKFALTGALSIHGRTSVKGKSFLQTLLPPGEKTLWATVTTGDGTIFRGELGRGAKVKLTVQRPGEDPMLLSPDAKSPFAVADVQSALTSSGANAIRWLSERVGLSMDDVSVLAAKPDDTGLPPSAMMLEYLSIFGEGAATPDDAISAAESTLKNCESARDRAIAEHAELSANAAPVPSLADLERAKNAVGQADASAQAWELHDANAAKYRALLTEYAACNATVKAAAGLPPAMPLELRAFWNSAADIAEASTAMGNSFCPCCGTNDVGDLRARANGLREWIAPYESSAIASDAALVASARMGAITAEAGELSKTLDSSRMDAIVQGAYQPIGPAAREHAQTVRAYEADLQAAVVTANAPDIAREAKVGAIARYDAANEATDRLRKAIAEVTGTKLLAFEDAVQAYLPPGWDRFTIKLRPAVMIGFTRGDGHFVVLSDGQEAVVLAAIALATANAPVIVSLPDRQIDGVTFDQVLRQFGAAKLPSRAALIAMTTHPYKPTDVIDGWDVIEPRSSIGGPGDGGSDTPAPVKKRRKRRTSEEVEADKAAKAEAREAAKAEKAAEKAAEKEAASAPSVAPVPVVPAGPPPHPSRDELLRATIEAVAEKRTPTDRFVPFTEVAAYVENDCDVDVEDPTKPGVYLDLRKELSKRINGYAGAGWLTIHPVAVGGMTLTVVGLGDQGEYYAMSENLGGDMTTPAEEAARAMREAEEAGQRSLLANAEELMPFTNDQDIPF